MKKLDKGIRPEGKSDIDWIPKKNNSLSNSRSEWTTKDDKFLANNWKSMPVGDIAKLLRRTIPGVKKRAIALGCVKNTPPK